MAELAKKAGRPRKFDPDTVLEQLMMVFWQKGYQGTSVDDLCRACGLTKPSLYGAFGDKRSCFVKALEHYLCKAPQRDRDYLESDKPIKAVMKEIMMRALIGFGDDSPTGCLQVIASTELGHLPEFQPVIAQGHRDNEKALERLLAKAQAEGRLDQSKDPAALALHFNVVIQGLSVKQKCGRSCESLEAGMDQALAVLD